MLREGKRAAGEGIEGRFVLLALDILLSQIDDTINTCLVVIVKMASIPSQVFLHCSSSCQRSSVVLLATVLLESPVVLSQSAAIGYSLWPGFVPTSLRSVYVRTT
jgi:hypothetical protein